MRRFALCALFLFCVFGLRSAAVAQSPSKVAADLAEARRDAEARESTRAFNAKRDADNAAAYNLRKADELALERERAEAPGRAARVTAEADARNAELKARDNSLNSMLAQSMQNAHVRAKKEELDALLANPPAPPVPGSYTECDELASAPFDGTRPLGIAGVDRNSMHTGAAIASCREELAKHPDSVRTQFELARALVYAGRCGEAVPAIKDAIAKGSAAAAVSYALLQLGGCKASAVPGDMEKYLKMASDMGSGDGAWLLAKYYSDSRKGLELNSPRDLALYKLQKEAYAHAVALVDARAKKGDLDALFIEADTAYFSSSTLGYDSINALYRCAVTGYAPCRKFDTVGGGK